MDKISKKTIFPFVSVLMGQNITTKDLLFF